MCLLSCFVCLINKNSYFSPTLVFINSYWSGKNSTKNEDFCNLSNASLNLVQALFELRRILPGNVYMQMRSAFKTERVQSVFEIKQTLEIALFIIVIAIVRTEREKFQHGQRNACTVLIITAILGKQKVNTNKTSIIIFLGLSSGNHSGWEAALRRWRSIPKKMLILIFNVHVHVTKRWIGMETTIQKCVLVQGLTRVCHKSLWFCCAVLTACFVSLCNSWKTLKWLVVRLYCFFFTLFTRFTSKPKNGFDREWERESVWDR